VDADQLESGLRALAAEDESSGVVLIVREGADLVDIVWGLANRSDEVPVARETRFGVASVSKMFTAAAIGRLVDAGTLSFDSPLVDCLPAELRPRDLDERMTLHHLLTHTSGLSDYSGEVISSEAYGELWAATPSYTFRRPSDLLTLFADKPRHADPGATVR